MVLMRNTRQHLLAVIIIVLLEICNALSTDLESDFRYISYKDLHQTSNRFTDGNVTSFSRLLFDVSGDQIIVGARDTLYRLSYDLKVKERAVWEPSPTAKNMCLDKGQSDECCSNYLLVLQSYQNRLFVCGTYAFGPQCSWRTLNNLTATSFEKGIAKCPFNPHANITSLMTADGQFFAGTPTDFSGSDPAIIKTDLLSNKQSLLRSKQYDSKWLNDPQFVGSFESGEFIYFVFRETASEYINCGKIVYSRIARVCKSDPGGVHILKDNWTSFIKARLNCSLPGEYPFYFNEVQGISYSHEDSTLYATFTTPLNSIHGSAICAFNMTAINAAFSGPFKYQESLTSNWEPKQTSNRMHSECRASRGTHRSQLLETSKYQLMDLAVQASTNQPIYFSKLERFTHIALDTVATKYHENVRVIYISTDEGLIKKISILPRTRQACLIEVWKPELEQSAKIITMQYFKNAESLYIGSDVAVSRIPAHHCERHVSKLSCINAMDPYCGWNELLELCTTPLNRNPLARHWVQDATECPILSASIDGGWSAWSDWNICAQNNGRHVDDRNSDSCLCRTRSCDNPSPKNGGSLCTGINIEVTNCTVHGGWTDWSAYSACTQTCGSAVKTRRRSCSNPKPAHGGRVCVGPDRSDIYCSNLPPCPIPKPTPIDGGWGPWGAWSECSAPCGSGFRIRRRKCNDPEPQLDGIDCTGCSIDYEVCNTQTCSEVRKQSSWTPWLIDSNGTTNNGDYIERRFRYSCSAPVADISSLKISLSKEETRLCSASGSCQRGIEGADNSGWSSWSQWGACSVSCGGGQQFRTRVCESLNCDGMSKMARACNTEPCGGVWSCWTDWSPCSVSCGVGIRTRTRDCLSTAECEGSALEEQICEMPSCDSFLGWSSWSDWSECNNDSEKVRTRECLLPDPTAKECQGEERERKPCSLDRSEQTLAAGVGTGLGIFIGLICGVLIGYFAKVYLNLYKAKNQPPYTIPSSPCYGPSPDHLYTSVPTQNNSEFKIKNIKVKRQSSFSKQSLDGSLKKQNNLAISNLNVPKSINLDNSAMTSSSYGLNNAFT